MVFESESFKKWVYSLEPKRPREGEFREVHKFPEDEKSYIIVFSCEPVLGGDFICAAIAVEGVAKE